MTKRAWSTSGRPFDGAVLACLAAANGGMVGDRGGGGAPDAGGGEDEGAPPGRAGGRVAIRAPEHLPMTGEEEVGRVAEDRAQRRPALEAEVAQRPGQANGHADLDEQVDEA